MDWCDANGVDYLQGLTGNAVLRNDTVLAIAADDCAVRRAVKDLPDPRCHPCRRTSLAPKTASAPPGQP